MKELLRLRVRDAVGRLAKPDGSRRPSLPALRARSLLAVCLLAGALAAGLLSAWGLAWFGGRAQAAASAAGLSLSPSSWPTYPDATFTMDIMADCSPNADSVTAKVTFPAARLQVQALTPDTSVFTTTLYQGYDNGTGQVEYEAGALACHLGGTCPSGSVRLATITFRALAPCGYSVPVGIQGAVIWQGLDQFSGTGTGSTVGISTAGDLDLDGGVDVVDIMLVAGRWGAHVGDAMYDARYDLVPSVPDGDITVADIVFVASRWNTTCSGGASLMEEVH